MEEEGGDIFTVYGCWIEVVDTAGVALGVGFGSSSFAFWLRESARLPVLCRARLAFEVCKQWAHAWYSLLFGCLGIRCNVGMPRAVNTQKKMSITVVAGSCTNEYQGGQLPSNNYRALPWWLDTAVNDTNQKKAYRSEPWNLWKVKFAIFFCHLSPITPTQGSTNQTTPDHATQW